MGNILFMQWFVNWYKGVHNEMNIQMSLPNTLSPFLDDNVVILDAFDKKKEVDAKTYLKIICQKADMFGCIIYLEPVPRTQRLSEEKKKIITKDWLIDYYSKFGFVLTSNKEFMKRLPQKVLGGLCYKIKYQIGGL